MHRLILLLFSFALVAGTCTAEEVTIKKLRIQFRTEVIKALGVRYENLNPRTSVNRVSMIARQTFSPHAELLKSAARREMSRLGLIHQADLATYKPKFPEKKDQISAALTAYQTEGQFLGIMYLDGWSMRTVAERAKQLVVPKFMDPTHLGNRTLMEKFIADVFYRLNDDYLTPQVVIKSLDEVFIVTLKMSDEGIYQPTTIEWLKKSKKKK